MGRRLPAGMFSARMHALRMERLAKRSDAETVKSAGQIAYEADCKARPTYHDGTPRKAWDALGAPERWSWVRNPTPR